MVVVPILGEGWQHMLDLLDLNVVRCLSETGKLDFKTKDFINVHCGTMIYVMKTRRIV